MSEQADRPSSSVLPMPAPYALATVRGAGSTRAPSAAAAARASTLRQNLGGGGPAGGALARGRAHAAVFFSHNPEAEAREGGEPAEGYRRGGSGALARPPARPAVGVLRHCGSEAVTPAPPEGGGGWSAAAAAERPGVAEAHGGRRGSRSRTVGDTPRSSRPRAGPGR